MTGRLLGREPVITVSTIVAMLIAVLPVFGWSTQQVGAVAAGLVVLGGAVEAGLVAVDRVLPLLVGIGKAVLAVVASFGVQLPDNWVSAVMALLTIVAGLQVRNQVVPPQPAQGDRGLGQGSAAKYAGFDAPPVPDRPGDTAVIELAPNSAYQLDATLTYGAQEDRGQHGDHQPRHRWLGTEFHGDLGLSGGA